MGDFIETTKEASIGGFKGIKKIRGLLVDLTKIPPVPGWESEKEQIKVDLEDVTILEMLNDDDPPVLKDGKYSFYVPYEKVGKRPSENSVYIKTWVASCERVYGKKPSELKGSYILLEKVPVLLFKKYKTEKKDGKDAPIIGEDGKKVLEDVLAVDQQGRPNHFCFVPEKAASDEDIKQYVTGLILGCNRKAALRRVALDQKLKQYPEYKNAFKDETIAAKLSLTIGPDEADVFKLG